MKFDLGIFRNRRRVLIAGSAAVILLVVIIASTVFFSQQNGGSASGPAGAAGSSSSTTPQVTPTFSASGTANDNIAYFRFLVNDAISREGLNASTQSLAQKLAAAGFDAAGIQYTDNSTAAGMTPDSVSVASLFKGQCLIAQYGPSLKDLSVALLPPLKSGGCLLGRSINNL